MIKVVPDEDNSEGDKKCCDEDEDCEDCPSSKNGSNRDESGRHASDIKRVLSTSGSFINKNDASPSHLRASNYHANRQTPKAGGKLGFSRMTEEKDEEFFKMGTEDRHNGINTTI